MQINVILHNLLNKNVMLWNTFTAVIIAELRSSDIIGSRELDNTDSTGLHSEKMNKGWESDVQYDFIADKTQRNTFVLHQQPPGFNGFTVSCQGTSVPSVSVSLALFSLSHTHRHTKTDNRHAEITHSLHGSDWERVRLQSRLFSQTFWKDERGLGPADPQALKYSFPSTQRYILKC